MANIIPGKFLGVIYIVAESVGRGIERILIYDCAVDHIHSGIYVWHIL